MTKPDFDLAIVCCRRMRPEDTEDAFPGSTIDVCSQCGYAIWVSPGSRAMQMQVTTIFICMECKFPGLDPVDALLRALSDENFRGFS